MKLRLVTVVVVVAAVGSLVAVGLVSFLCKCCCVVRFILPWWCGGYSRQLWIFLCMHKRPSQSTTRAELSAKSLSMCVSLCVCVAMSLSTNFCFHFFIPLHFGHVLRLNTPPAVRLVVVIVVACIEMKSFCQPLLFLLRIYIFFARPENVFCAASLLLMSFLYRIDAINGARAS